MGLAASPALATHFQPESYTELLAQLHKREIVAIVLHPTGPKAHASARNGQHFTVTYTAGGGSAAEGGRDRRRLLVCDRHGEAQIHHDPPQTALHRGRDLIVVIVVVLVVLLIGRRRTLEEEGPGGEAASASPPAGPS